MAVLRAPILTGTVVVYALVMLAVRARCQDVEEHEPLTCFHCTENENCNENLGRSAPCQSPYDRCATFYDSTNTVKVTSRGCDRRILSGCYRTGTTTQACVCSFDHCNNFKIQDLNLAFTREEIASRAADIFRKSAGVDNDKTVENDAKTPETVDDMLNDARERAGQMLARSFLKYQLEKTNLDRGIPPEKDVVVRRNVVKNLVANYLRSNPTHDVEVVQMSEDDIHLHFYETVTPKPTVINVQAVMEEAQNIVKTSGAGARVDHARSVLGLVLLCAFRNVVLS